MTPERIATLLSERQTAVELCRDERIHEIDAELLAAGVPVSIPVSVTVGSHHAVISQEHT